MDDKFSPSLILLTYKNKALLMYKQKSPIDLGKHEWSFLTTTKNIKNSFQDTFKNIVKEELGIKVGEIECISEFCYHANLTDDNVNQINRSEGQLLDFFNFQEIQKLLLSKSTQDFISKHGSLIYKNEGYPNSNQLLPRSS